MSEFVNDVTACLTAVDCVTASRWGVRGGGMPPDADVGSQEKGNSDAPDAASVRSQNGRSENRRPGLIIIYLETKSWTRTRAGPRRTTTRAVTATRRQQPLRSQPSNGFWQRECMDCLRTDSGAATAVVVVVVMA